MFPHINLACNELNMTGLAKQGNKDSHDYKSRSLLKYTVITSLNARYV